MHVTRCGSYSKGAFCFAFQSQLRVPTVDIFVKCRDVCLDILNPNLSAQRKNMSRWNFMCFVRNSTIIA